MSIKYYRINTVINDCFIFNPYENGIILGEISYGLGLPPDLERSTFPLIRGLNCGIFCFKRTISFVRYPYIYLGPLEARNPETKFYFYQVENEYFNKQSFLVVEKSEVPSLKNLCIINLTHILPGRPNNKEIGEILDTLSIPLTLKRDICENRAFIFNITIDSYFTFLRPCIYCYRKTRKTGKLASHKGPQNFYQGERGVEDSQLTSDEEERDRFLQALIASASYHAGSPD
jgi:hypothetical protein